MAQLIPRFTIRKALAAGLVGALAAAAGCTSPPSARGLPSDALDQAIGNAVGDPSTCVILADRATGKVVYRYGQQFNCLRGLPACDRPGFLSASQAMAFAETPGGRTASCNSGADSSRQVGWAEGQAASAGRRLNYSAVMEGQSALPGREMAARLDDAFRSAGL